MSTASSLRGILLVAGATFFWSLSGVFVRWLPESVLPPSEMEDCVAFGDRRA